LSEGVVHWGWAMPVDAEPANEFERGLSEALKQGIDQREALVGLLELIFLEG